jgi:hypothetical protein
LEFGKLMGQAERLVPAQWQERQLVWLERQLGWLERQLVQLEQSERLVLAQWQWLEACLQYSDQHLGLAEEEAQY